MTIPPVHNSKLHLWTSGRERQIGPFSGLFLDIGPDRDQVPKSGFDRSHCLCGHLIWRWPFHRWPTIFHCLKKAVDDDTTLSSDCVTAAQNKYKKNPVLEAVVMLSDIFPIPKQRKKVGWCMKWECDVSVLNERRDPWRQVARRQFFSVYTSLACLATRRCLITQVVWIGRTINRERKENICTSWCVNHLCPPCHMLFPDEQAPFPAKWMKQRMTKQGQTELKFS